MKKQKFEDLLELCLERLDRGEDLPVVLESYPTFEAQLKPILLVAMLGRALPQPAPRHTSIRTGMNYVLTEMDIIQAGGGFKQAKPLITPERGFGRWLESLPNPFSPERVSGLKLSYRLAIMTLVVVLSGGFLTLSASASGFSGNVFTNLKRGLERVRSVLIINGTTAATLLENEEFPPREQPSQKEVTGIGEEIVIPPIVKAKPKNEGIVSEPGFTFDGGDTENIKELKEIEKEEKIAEKEAEKEEKLEDKKDKKEKEIKAVKPENDKKDKKNRKDKKK